MILLENLILLIVLTALFAAAAYLSLTMTKKLIPAVVSAVTELGVAVFLLFKGATIEELFLMVLIFGGITVSLNYYCKRESDGAEKSGDAETK